MSVASFANIFSHSEGCLLVLFMVSFAVIYFFAVSLSFFFYEWDCVPVLLVVWPEASNTRVCRLLGRAGSWC